MSEANHPTPEQKLSELQQKFVQEAHAGFFGVVIEDDGRVYAMGAKHASNLFSMPVREIDDPYNQGSIYEPEEE